jgi:hypothetical protein
MRQEETGITGLRDISVGGGLTRRWRAERKSGSRRCDTLGVPTPSDGPFQQTTECPPAGFGRKVWVHSGKRQSVGSTQGRSHSPSLDDQRRTVRGSPATSTLGHRGPCSGGSLSPESRRLEAQLDESPVVSCRSAMSQRPHKLCDGPAIEIPTSPARLRTWTKTHCVTARPGR